MTSAVTQQQQALPVEQPGKEAPPCMPFPVPPPNPQPEVKYTKVRNVVFLVSHVILTRLLLQFLVLKKSSKIFSIF